MAQSSASQRYAASLLELAAERGELETVKADVEAFAATLKQEPALAQALASPVIASERKLAILRALYAERFTPLLNQFFEIISRRGREPLLKEIAGEFIRQYLLRKGITSAKVISARPLDAAALQQVQSLAERISGLKIELEQALDASLIGGFILRVGDKQIDQSVASQLGRVGRSLKAGV